MSAPLSQRARWSASEEGSATVEFVLLFPVFILVMVNAIEASVLMTRSVLLDRGLDLAVRDLRLETDDPPGFAAFKDRVCERAALITGCREGLQIEMRRVSTQDWALMDPEVRCLDRAEEIDPLVEDDPALYELGMENELMMVRACLVVNPIVPNLGLGAILPVDGSGGYGLISVSAFVQEPSGTGT